MRPLFLCFCRKIRVLHIQRVLGLRAIRLADDTGAKTVLCQCLGKRLEGGAVGAVLKGEVLFLARRGVFDLRKMAMKGSCVIVSETASDGVEDAAIAVGIGEEDPSYP